MNPEELNTMAEETVTAEYIPSPPVDDELDWENGPENENEEEES